MRELPFHLLMALAMLLAVGCAGNSKQVYRGLARVTAEEAAAAPSPQARVVPWSGQTLRASATFVLPAPQDGEPGLPTGVARLRAREAAIDSLARQLGRLPGAEAPPGETRESNVEQLARRHPALTRAIERELLAATESVRYAPEERRGLVELELPLANVARSVLEVGGGFRREDRVVEAIGPSALALRRAAAEAERELMESIVEARLDSKRTWAQWLRENPLHLQEFLKALQENRKILQSGPDPASENENEYVVEYEVDLEPLRKSIRQRERQSRRKRSVP